MAPTLRTLSTSHLRQQREAHRRADNYGRHRHLYLHDTMRRLAGTLREMAPGAVPTWLDYGCGKGEFIAQITALGLFTSITGHDPAVGCFSTRPSAQFDLVTCLDVLDIVEPQCLDAVLADVAQFTSRLALFDCLTRPKPESGLRPHAPFYWTMVVARRLHVVETWTAFPGIHGFERVLIIAAPTPPGRPG
jgi:hypothetical protein